MNLVEMFISMMWTHLSLSISTEQQGSWLSLCCCFPSFLIVRQLTNKMIININYTQICKLFKLHAWKIRQGQDFNQLGTRYFHCKKIIINKTLHSADKPHKPFISNLLNNIRNYKKKENGKNNHKIRLHQMWHAKERKVIQQGLLDRDAA